MVRFFLGFIHTIRRARERRLVARELLSLNDRLLKDIGLRPSQIGYNGAALFKEIKPLIKRQRPAAIGHMQPSLQGCG